MMNHSNKTKFVAFVLFVMMTMVHSQYLEDSSYIRLSTDAQGTFVRVNNQQYAGVVADSSIPAFINMFRVRLVPNRRDQVQLLAQNHKWVSGDLNKGGQLFADRDSPSGWETWNYRLINNTKIQLQHAISGKWVSAVNGGGGALIADRDEPSQWETFRMERMNAIKGVNLGSYLIPEKWMVPDVYEGTGADDLFTLCKNLGPEKALERMKQHMATFISRDDFKWLADHGFNSVRLPIGYWDIEEDTKYHVYVGGGQPFIEKTLDWAEEFGISVLIDLHGAVGSQNGQDHSGRKGPIDFDPQATLIVIKKIVQMYGWRKNLIGIELLNEPNVDAIGVERLKQYYLNAYQIINSTRPDIMIMFHDGFWPLSYWTDFLRLQNVVVDTHRYQLFTQKEQDMTLQQHYEETTNEWFPEISSSRYHLLCDAS